MAKKNRKTPGTRKPLHPASTERDVAAESEDVEPEEEEEEDEAPVLAPARTPPSGMSPLQRSQEIELEIGLTVLGAVVGGLTGYGYNVSMDAATGNVMGAVELGLVGALMGYSLGRTLFLSVRAQWISWAVLIAIAYGGFFLGGLHGAVAGAVIGTVAVVMGVFGREDDDSGDGGTIVVKLPEESSSGGTAPQSGPFLPNKGKPSYPAPPKKLNP